MNEQNKVKVLLKQGWIQELRTFPPNELEKLIRDNIHSNITTELVSLSDNEWTAIFPGLSITVKNITILERKLADAGFGEQKMAAFLKALN